MVVNFVIKLVGFYTFMGLKKWRYTYNIQKRMKYINESIDYLKYTTNIYLGSIFFLLFVKIWIVWI